MNQLLFKMLTTSWPMQTAKLIFFGLVLKLLQVFQKHPINTYYTRHNILQS